MSVNDKGNDLSDQPVIETASFRVSEPVKNRTPRKRRVPKMKPAGEVEHIKVDPQVMAAAKRLVRSNTRLVIVSENEVRVVNR